MRVTLICYQKVTVYISCASQHTGLTKHLSGFTTLGVPSKSLGSQLRVVHHLMQRYVASDSKNPRLIRPRVVYLSSKRAINLIKFRGVPIRL